MLTNAMQLLGNRWRDFRDARDGVSAVEFALLAPIMLTMWLGTVEVGQALGIHWKSKLVARTLADLTARATTIHDADLTNIFAATTAVLYPYDSSKLSMRVSSVHRDSSNKDVVVWSNSSTGSALAPRVVNSAVTLPTGMLTKPGDSVVYSEVMYKYQPKTKFIPAEGILSLTGTGSGAYFAVKYEYYMVPRQVPEVARVSP